MKESTLHEVPVDLFIDLAITLDKLKDMFNCNDGQLDEYDLDWSYFHKLYEDNSDLARNFLVITPNIIVLDRIRADFDGLKIFYQEHMTMR